MNTNQHPLPKLAGQRLQPAAAHLAPAHRLQSDRAADQTGSEPSISELAPAEFPGRLIPLCDGRRGVRATLQIEAQSEIPDLATSGAGPLPVIDFVSSDAALDRYDEIISPAGWRLDNYR